MHILFTAIRESVGWEGWVAFMKASSKYYTGLEIKILLPHESLSLASSFCYWYSQNLDSIFW